jgi:kinesin family protein C1
MSLPWPQKSGHIGPTKATIAFNCLIWPISRPRNRKRSSRKSDEEVANFGWQKSMSSMGHSRNQSFTSSTTSRTQSVSSRNTSNGSFSSSVGPGSRPISAYGNRPQTSMAFSQSTTTRPKTALPKSRPATAMENHDSDDEDMPSNGKRKGMMKPLPPIPSSFSSSRSTGNMRDVSVSTAMSRLCIDDLECNNSPEHQASSSRMKPPSSPRLSHKPSITTGMRNLRLNDTSTENAMVLYQAPGDSLVAPKTPSHIPVLVKSKSRALRDTPTTPSRMTPRSHRISPKKTPSRTTPSRSRKSSPKKTTYLSKGSVVPAFTESDVGFLAWDVRGRLEDMEAMYSELKDTLNGTTLERNGLDEAVAVYKARGW